MAPGLPYPCPQTMYTAHVPRRNTIRRNYSLLTAVIGVVATVFLASYAFSGTNDQLMASVANAKVGLCAPLRSSMKSMPLGSTLGRGRSIRRDVSMAAKGKQTMRRGQEPGRVMRNIPPTPPVDPQNEEFVIFVRSRMQRTWLPMSMVKGGWQANAIISQQRNEFGKNLFGKTLDDTLTRNIATAIYQDSNKLSKNLTTNSYN
eukprot:jgi/Bigna1/91819/estExt_fgenesh1_pg.C_1220003